MKIYITAYPRSGNTWLVRLLSDLLDSPQTGPEVTPPIYWGNQGGEHQVSKTHWLAHEYTLGNAWLVANKRLNELRPSNNHKMVFIQRDPRDVAVSIMYYRSLEPTDANLLSTIETMANYEPWLGGWLESGKYDVITRYELLSDFNELRRIVYELIGKMLLEDRIKQSMERQSFGNVAPKFPHSMRKGIVGDWKNHFKLEHCKRITEILGEFMLRQGYINSLEWF